MSSKQKSADSVDPSQVILRCSFCNKTQHDVRKLIGGPTLFICDGCVDVCNDIIADDPSEPTEVTVGRLANGFPNATVNGPMIQCALCRMPMIISDGLPIQNRGVVCFGCIGEIEVAIAERRGAGS